VDQERDANQKISGDENFQAGSGRDLSAAVGDQAVAAGGDVIKAGRDIVINHIYQTAIEHETSTSKEVKAEKSDNFKPFFKNPDSETSVNEFDFVTSTKQESYQPENFSLEIKSEKSYLVEKKIMRYYTLLMAFGVVTTYLSFALIRLEDIWGKSFSELISLQYLLEMNNLRIGYLMLILITMLATARIICTKTWNEIYLAQYVIKATKIPLLDEDIGEKNSVYVMAISLFLTLTFGIGNSLWLPFIVSFFILSYIIVSNINLIGYLNIPNIAIGICIFHVNLILYVLFCSFIWELTHWSVLFIFGFIYLLIAPVIFWDRKIKLDFNTEEVNVFCRKNIRIIQEVFARTDWEKSMPKVSSVVLMWSYVRFVRYGISSDIRRKDIENLSQRNLTFQKMLSEIDFAATRARRRILEAYSMYVPAAFSLLLSIFVMRYFEFRIHPKSDDCKAYLHDLIKAMADIGNLTYENSSIFSFSEIDSELLIQRINPEYTWYEDGIYFCGISHSLIDIFDLRRNLSDLAEDNAFSDVRGLDELAEKLSK
jgi:hypothetical protein